MEETAIKAIAIMMVVGSLEAMMDMEAGSVEMATIIMAAVAGSLEEETRLVEVGSLTRMAIAAEMTSLEAVVVEVVEVSLTRAVVAVVIAASLAVVVAAAILLVILWPPAGRAVFLYLW